tara:strand:+ start:5675 stop:6313 length:639 start_codon:yes stop_codon:yes gene_type:complete
MKVVKVYGALKKRLGGQGTFEFDVFNAAEAVKALCANFPGLDKWFIDSGNDGIRYKVLMGETSVTTDNVDNLLLPWSEKEVFHITPVLMGAKWWRKLLIGAALVGIAVFAPTYGIAAMQGFSWSVAGVTAGLMAASPLVLGVAMAGVGLIIGGIADVLSPTPKPPPEANKLKSFAFSGIEQTSKQGAAIPIVYGKCFVGSAVLSSGVDTFDA